jgi:hypothetical protein
MPPLRLAYRNPAPLPQLELFTLGLHDFGELEATPAPCPIVPAWCPAPGPMLAHRPAPGVARDCRIRSDDVRLDRLTIAGGGMSADASHAGLLRSP